MMKGYILAALLLVSALPARAQIEITEADIRSYFNTQVTLTDYSAEDASVLQGLVGATGANQTWDFRGATYAATEIATNRIVDPPVPGSDDPHLGTANVILMAYVGEEASPDSVAYAFIHLDADAFTFLGISGTVETEEGTEPFLLKFDPGWVQMQLPLQHNSAWTNTYTADFGIPGFESTVEEEVTCDGWGTLVTPDGQYAALRCTETTTTTIFGFASSSTTISFYTRSAVGAALDLDDDGNVAGASYTSVSGGGGVDVEQGAQLPEAFTLEQNYPNPFNPSTVIPFTLTESSHVTLKVYDGLGREVATLADGFRAAGDHRVEWRANDLPSGPYLYRLDVGGQLRSRTLVLQK